MDEKTKGAWIVHHKNKLDDIAGTQSDFENIILAGKCSALLSTISGTDQINIKKEKVDALASAVGINKKLELPSILATLQTQRLINIGTEYIEVLGLTTSTILEQTTKIYSDNNPNRFEEAVIDLSEKASSVPLLEERAIEYIGDSYKLDTETSRELITESKQIGFFDSEETNDNKCLLFNGNLFRNQNMTKVDHVLSALSQSDSDKMTQARILLNNSGCISYDTIINITGKELFDKLQSIGIFDVNSITNEMGKYLFVTSPSSFCKYNSSLIDDAFDLAKAFVVSLTYGMNQRSAGLGRIKMIEPLLKKLITGYWVGPATAIGQDYKILELKGVIQVRKEKGGLYSMKLLKQDVGKLALSVIQDGTADSNILSYIPSASVSDFIAPEKNRINTRKQLTIPIRKSVSEILNNLRTGEF